MVSYSEYLQEINYVVQILEMVEEAGYGDMEAAEVIALLRENEDLLDALIFRHNIAICSETALFQRFWALPSNALKVLVFFAVHCSEDGNVLMRWEDLSDTLNISSCDLHEAVNILLEKELLSEVTPASERISAIWQVDPGVRRLIQRC